MYIIEKYKLDTLWLMLNLSNGNGQQNTFLVRFQKKEHRILDHQWTNNIRDSLMARIGKDFDRRRWKFYSIRGHDMTGYDSALRVGYWD